MKRILCLLLISISLNALGQNYEETEPEEHVLLNQPVPAFTAMTLNGKTINLPDKSNKIVVLHIWDIRCSACYKELPELNVLAKTYADKNVLVIALMKDSISDIFTKIEFSDEYYKLKKEVHGNSSIDFQIIPDAKDLISLFEMIDKKGSPQTFVIDKNGIVREFTYGYRMTIGGNPKPEESDNFNLLKEKIERTLIY